MLIPYLFQEHYKNHHELDLTIPTLTQPSDPTIKNIIITEDQTLENWGFVGTKGLGKTTKAFIIYKLRKEYLEKRINDKNFVENNSKYIKAEEYLELCQKAMSIPSCYQLIDDVKNIQFLILDEIKTDKQSITVINRLTSLLEHRRDYGLQTIFTSNDSPRSIIEVYPDLGNAMMAMTGKDNLLLFAGTNKHINQESQKPELYTQICQA